MRVVKHQMIIKFDFRLNILFYFYLCNYINAVICIKKVTNNQSVIK
jgi:hypothetical protein